MSGLDEKRPEKDESPISHKLRRLSADLRGPWGEGRCLWLSKPRQLSTVGRS